MRYHELLTNNGKQENNNKIPIRNQFREVRKYVTDIISILKVVNNTEMFAGIK